MKRVVILLLFLTGCATSSEKATAYCDANWQNRYDSWQACYDRQVPLQNKGLKAVGSLFGGMGQGLQDAQKNRGRCSTWDGKTTCN